MFKLIRFILLLIGKVLIWCLVIPSFTIIVILAAFVEANSCPHINEIYDWYEDKFVSIIDWFKDFWREA